MPRYRVYSGTLKTTVVAKTPIDALKQAIMQRCPRTLGHIAEITNLDAGLDDPEATGYVSIEHVLREMGKWSEEPR